MNYDRWPSNIKASAMKSFLLKTYHKVPSSGYKSFLLSYPTLLIISVLIFIYYYIEYGSPVYLFDTKSYIAASFQIMQGIPDSFRTPVYPFLIGLSRYFFGDSWDVILMLVQYFVMLVSIRYLYKTMARVVPRPRLVFWAVAFYAINPGIINYSFQILTESLAVSFMIFFAFTVVNILTNTRTPMRMSWPVMWMSILIYLRPVFVYLIPVLGLFYLYLTFRHKIGRPSAIIGIITLTLALVSVCVYQSAITKLYGIHSISSVTIYNNYYALRYDGIIDPSLAPTPELTDLIESTIPKKNSYSLEEADRELREITNVTEDRVLEEYEKNLIKKYPKDFIKSILLRWSTLVIEYHIFPGTPANWKVQLLEILYPNMGAYCLFLIVYAVILITLWRRSNRFPETKLFLLLVCLGLFVITALGAQAEYTRLNLPALPVFLILAADFSSHFRFKLE